MRMSSRLGLLATAGVLGGGVGLAVSFLLAPPRGPDHKCPPQASLDACTYPPSYAHWHIGWVVAGVLVGVIVALFALAAYNRRH